jgi:hypothetical protein
VPFSSNFHSFYVGVKHQKYEARIAALESSLEQSELLAREQRKEIQSLREKLSVYTKEEGKLASAQEKVCLMRMVMKSFVLNC